jgi:hypothetical protein
MKESKVKEFFEKFNNHFDKILEHDAYFDGSRRIDYITIVGEKTAGIEVKGSRSELFGAIGQLLIMKKVFSELYLLAPLMFIKKFLKITDGIASLNEIGLLTISNNRLIVLKKPDAPEYYFKPRIDLKKLRAVQPKKLPKEHLVSENDRKVYQHFKERVFTVIDIMNEFQLTRAGAYMRISRLKRIGAITEENPLQNPRVWKFVKPVEEMKIIKHD